MKKHFLYNPASQAYILSILASFPFWGIINLLPMILIKEFNASLFQLSTIAALKPLSSLFASYWNNFFFNKDKNIFVTNIKISSFLFCVFH